MPMFSILCCTSGTAEQLSSLHALSSTIVLVIHQNSGWNIVANRYSDSKYTGPFSCTVWSVHVYRQNMAPLLLQVEPFLVPL